MFVNARSLKKSGATSDLLADILENNIQLCCVTETWFNSEFPSSNFFIPNYNLIRHDRTPSNSDKKQVVESASITMKILKFNLWMYLDVNSLRSYGQKLQLQPSSYWLFCITHHA